jgi:hypothetical protein
MRPDSQGKKAVFLKKIGIFRFKISTKITMIFFEIFRKKTLLYKAVKIHHFLLSLVEKSQI